MWLIKKLGWLALGVAFSWWGFDLILFQFTDYPVTGGGELHFVYRSVPGSAQHVEYYWAIDVHQSYAIVVCTLAAILGLCRLPLHWTLIALTASAAGIWRWWVLAGHAEDDWDRHMLQRMVLYLPVFGFVAAWLAHRLSAPLSAWVSRARTSHASLVNGVLVGVGGVVGTLIVLCALNSIVAGLPAAAFIVTGGIMLGGVGIACGRDSLRSALGASITCFVFWMIFTHTNPWSGSSRGWMEVIFPVVLAGALLGGGILGHATRVWGVRAGPRPRSLSPEEIDPPPP
jgi:hypothetical protein